MKEIPIIRESAWERSDDQRTANPGGVILSPLESPSLLSDGPERGNQGRSVNTRIKLVAFTTNILVDRPHKALAYQDICCIFARIIAHPHFA